MSGGSTTEKKGPYLQRVASLKESRPYSPCRAACPVNTDVQAYVGFIAQRRYTEAFEVIRSVNPIASVCSMIWLGLYCLTQSAELAQPKPKQ